jgi:hypothetical protein
MTEEHLWTEFVRDDVRLRATISGLNGELFETNAITYVQRTSEQNGVINYETGALRPSRLELTRVDTGELIFNGEFETQLDAMEEACPEAARAFGLEPTTPTQRI